MNLIIQQNPNFKAIQLSAKETEKAKGCINRLIDVNISVKERQSLKNGMFDVFDPHLQKEARYKSKFYIFEEVLAELYLKFSELLDDIKNCSTLEYFIEELNKYKPSKDTLKTEYIHQSLDEYVYWNNDMLRKADLITSKKLPVPRSSEYIEKIKERIEKAIKQEKISSTIKKRMEARLKGVTYKEIAEKDNVSSTSAARSVQRGILRIQYENSNISEKYTEKASILANLLGCKTEDVIKMYLKHQAAFNMKPETILQNAKKLAELLNCSEEKVIAMGLKRPEIILQKPETLNRNIETTAKLFGCSKEEFLRASLKYLYLFYIKPETLLKNVLRCAELFNSTKETIIKSALKRPELLCRTPEVLKKNIQKMAKNIGCSEEELTKVALYEPSLFCMKPETVIQNVKGFSVILRCSEKEFVETAMRCPKLFMMSKDTLKNRLKAGAKIFNSSEYEFGKMGLARPHLLIQKAESINSKLKVENYYRKVKNEPLKTVPCKISDEVVYTHILVYLLQKVKIEGAEEMLKIKKKFNFEEFVKTFQNKTFSFEIPEDEVAEDFIRFVQEKSTKTIGKNIFEFKLVKQTLQK